jgi:hypothetical protein
LTLNSLDELRHLCKVELAHLLDPEASLLHCIRDGHRLKVASMVNNPARDVNERIVRRRVEFDLESRVGADQVGEERAEPLFPACQSDESNDEGG